MYELLRALPAGARVLDLGCASGSFRADEWPFAVIRVDLERPAEPASNFVQADAAKLPFPAACFDVVISNHSLEHFEDLDAALAEVARVVKPEGSFYAAVPDASTISDRLYRWLAGGGGHVNGFVSAAGLAARVEKVTELKHRATRTLCTSLSCFNRRNIRTRAPRRLILIGGGTEFSLRFLTYAFRVWDRLFRTRFSVYGWALYFGRAETAIDTRTATNVCIRCGSGHASAWLLEDSGRVRRRFVLRTYACPSCGAKNLFTDDPRPPASDR